MRAKTGISERRACALIGLSRTVLHYDRRTCGRREALRGRVVSLAAQRRRFGYRRIHALLRREGEHVNVKCVHRLYREERLQVQRRRRRKRVAVERRPLVEPERPNQVWSMGFVSDSLQHGRRLKCLTIVDDFSKEAVDIVVDHGISGQYVTRVLDAIATTLAAASATRPDSSPTARSAR
jgi:putative transposase